MNKTHNNGAERNAEQVEVAQKNLAGLREMGPDELAAVEGGAIVDYFIPTHISSLVR